MSAQPPIAILVLGMHRSGTSAMTRVLNLLGAELGEHLLPPAGDNREGFWENQRVVEIDEQLLAAVGRHWHDVRELPEGWLDSQGAHTASAAIEGLLRAEFHGAPLWAIKDPRLCRVGSVWIDTMRRQGIKVVVLVVARDPREVVGSLTGRDGWSEAQASLLYLEHLIQAEALSRDVPRCLVTYEELLGDWRGAVQRIAAQLHLAWPADASAAGRAIDAFIDVGLRHHDAAKQGDVAASLRWPLAVYHAAQAARTQEAGWNELQRIGELYRRAGASFGPYIDELAAKLRRTDEERHYYNVMSDRGQQEIAELQRALAGADALLRQEIGGLYGAMENQANQLRAEVGNQLAQAESRTAARFSQLDARIAALHDLAAAQDEAQRRSASELAAQQQANRSQLESIEDRSAGHDSALRELVLRQAAQANVQRAMLNLLARQQARAWSARFRRWLGRECLVAGTSVAYRKFAVRGANDIQRGRRHWNLATEWVAGEHDPQLQLLATTEAPLASGWYLLRLDLRRLRGDLAAPCLYPDYGQGYSEEECIKLTFERSIRQELLVYFPHTVRALRFDPSTGGCVFALSALRCAALDEATALTWLEQRAAASGAAGRDLWYEAWKVPSVDPVVVARTLAQQLPRLPSLPSARGRIATLFGGVTAARTQGESWWTIVYNARDALHKEGAGGFMRRLKRFLDSAERRNVIGADSTYERWIAQQPRSDAAQPAGPLISIIMPTYRPITDFLRAAFDSVRAQTYAHWELCIADDASPEGDVAAILAQYADSEPRLRWTVANQRGGIAANTCAALALASGDYCLFLDHDDVLTEDALAQLVAHLQATPQDDIVYSDHDCLAPDGRRCNPFFKPDWNPDLLLAQMYLGHFVAIRRSLIQRVGGPRSVYDGAQDYDLVLRCIAAGARVGHVPKIHYHWRQHAQSTAANPQSKPYAHEAGRAAIQNHLDVAAPGAIAHDGAFLFTYDVRYPLPGPVRASLIIPTRDRIDLLAPCLDSIFSRTDFPGLEVIVVDNGSVDEATRAYLAQATAREKRLRVMTAPVPFNWSHLNNLAATQASGDVLVFLNNDTLVISPDWLQRLTENALRPDIAACGPLLLYEDGNIQHAGVVVGLGGWADHVFKGLAPEHRQDLFVSPLMRRNVLAVTGACMAIAADKFRALGRFDESFIVCGSDVELCLRAHRAGYRNLYLPEARLFHLESRSRDPRAIPEGDFARSVEAYGEFRTDGDPYYNPNLDPAHCAPTLRWTEASCAS